MNAEEFARKITDLKPSPKELIGVDYPKELIIRWLEEFDIKKLSSGEYDNPILTLIHCYDLNSLSFSGITLDKDYFDDGEYFCFGWDIVGDRIAIYNQNGKIVTYDVYGDRLTFVCAENAEKFLDALIEIMKFEKENIIKNCDEETRNKRSKEVAYIASLKAGGEEYEDYYKSILCMEE